MKNQDHVIFIIAIFPFEVCKSNWINLGL